MVGFSVGTLELPSKSVVGDGVFTTGVDDGDGVSGDAEGTWLGLRVGRSVLGGTSTVPSVGDSEGVRVSGLVSDGAGLMMGARDVG